MKGLYDEPRWEKEHETWAYLRDLAVVSNLPWMVIGDINEILYDFGKEGGNLRPAHYIRAFRDALTDCDLSDFGYTEDKFTWHRGVITHIHTHT